MELITKKSKFQMSKFKYLSTDRWRTSVDRNPNHIQEELFTPLESPGTYAGDVIIESISSL